MNLAVIDLAAKAFCRVAVSALLARLELIESFIPFIGEIAITLAIIAGCVKSMEKEGKSVKYDVPKTQPTDVPDRPNPKSVIPTKSGDKSSPTCSRNSKRATPVESTHNIDDTAMRIMKALANKHDDSWRDGDG
ncbi:hypothetical protein RRF57_005885 [Xylaria bambusicola]|uniref:Uncharacterized protein n=1 Tax=Xylaria bambusicola TaxID=326684 RepID=A0AAN7YY56_9PEZI